MPAPSGSATAVGTRLCVRGLTWRYGERIAVRDVDLDCHRGEILGLLGPNGAGKTTLLSCIAGLLETGDGTMTFGGAPFRPARDAADRRRIGLVPQEIALYDDLSARENLTFFARLHGVAAAATAAVVERGLVMAGLVERAGDRVRTFSGGMKRRLNLAVGTLHAPELLLLDEPTVGVDPQSRNHLFECLRTLRSEGRSLLYTSHTMGEVQKLCDRVAVMHEGAVIAVGTTAELAARAGTPDADLEQVFLALTGHSLRDDA